MRRPVISIIALCLILLPLTACSNEQSADERVLELRELLTASTQNFSAEITADYGDHTYDFTLKFDSAAGTLDVLAPEIIAGIQIGLSESGTVLYYDDAELDTGGLTEDGLSPVAALPAIVYEWKEGYIAEAHYETYEGISCVVMTTSISDTVSHASWFDDETGIPVKAEIAADGRTVITCIFEGSPLFGQK